ncbi:MAG: hypothetical protein AAFY41_03980 [Bacteroidota bacterium]
MEDIPGYVTVTFIAIVIAILGFIYYAISTASLEKKNLTPSIVITLVLGWIFFVSVQTFNGYFTNLSGIPRLPLFFGLTSGMVFMSLVWSKSRRILINMPITTLHYIHIVRVPIEMVLWWLAVSQAIPTDMTFEGSNMDILSGISAPFAAVFMVGSRSTSRIGAIIWNLIALLLLGNFVRLAIFYMPYYYTPVGTEVINLGVFYFPFVLLLTFIVPSILFCHLVSIYQLIFKKDQSQF